MTVNRREFLQGSLAAVAAAGCGEGRPMLRRGERPNVLFLVIDDLNDWVGCLGGHPDARTPNIDALAERGTLFTRAYCPSPLCNPSRVATLTGLQPSTTGIYRNAQRWRRSMPGVASLPELFRDHGYAVVGGGKIFHAGYPRRWLRPLPWSVSRFWLEERWGTWDDFFLRRPEPFPAITPANGIPGTEFDWAGLEIPVERTGDFQLAQWAASQLDRRWDRPFFLGCGFFHPHPPWYAPTEFFEMHLKRDARGKPLPTHPRLPDAPEDDLDDVPELAREWARAGGWHASFSRRESWWRGAVLGYLASTTFVDHCVGHVIDALDVSANARDTIVVLWSDHGWHLGEKSHWGKRTLWEESTRVPLLVSAPGGPEGGRCSRTVSLTDLYPTLAELCGLTPPPGLEGESLAPLLEDPSYHWPRPVLTTYERGSHSIRSEDWRYIRYPDGEEELYDMERDPSALRNLAGDPAHGATKNELSRWLPEADAPVAPV